MMAGVVVGDRGSDGGLMLVGAVEGVDLEGCVDVCP